MWGSLVRTAARFAGRHFLRRGLEAASDPEVRERVRERFAAGASQGGDGMLGRLDDEAKRVVVFARDEAQNALGHEQIGTEHLLLGLLRPQGDGAGRTEAMAAFDAVGVSRPGVMREVVEVSGERTARPVEDPPFTRDARRSLVLAGEEADRLGHREVRPGHLLLAVLLLDDGAGVQVLRRLDVDLQRLWAVTHEELSGWSGHVEEPSGRPEDDRDALEERLSAVESRLEALERRLASEDDGP